MAHDHDNLRYLHHHHRPYVLTALQIGDLQSYVSKLFLHIVHEETKLVFLVDNEPWTVKQGRSKPAELWQLMVFQSRASPFANYRLKSAGNNYNGRVDCNNGQENADEELNVGNKRTRRKLFQKYQRHLSKSIRDVLQHPLKSVVSVEELSYLLHGCVAFELDWANVRGINYLNELQTDTCVALETKLMTKRDFDSLQQALAFYGCKHESAGHEVRVSVEGKRDGLPSNVEVEYAQAAACTGTSSSRSVLAKRRRCSTCTKLEGDCHDGCFDGDSLECRICSTLDTDMPGSYQLKKRQVYRLGQCSLLGDSSSHQPRKGNASPEASMIGDMVALQDDDCQFADAVQCCWHSNGAASFDTSSCNCNMTMGKDSWTGGKKASRDDEDRRLSSQSSDGRFHPWRSPVLCCQKKDGGAMVLEHSYSDSHVYRDMLVLFRFCDPILPIEFKNIITADQRLLKMLESGLPSWVIFLQSYPLVCKIYRPWMRPFAKTMYFLISIVTVIIGFYDLYKNVPVLKATAARICGPLFEWIEAWEMVSRLKYLGTMLFLQNCEKAFQWLLMIFRTSRQLSTMLMRPMIEPLEDIGEILWPAWSVLSDGVLGLATLLWMIFSALFEYTSSFLQLIIWPFVVLLTAIWRLATLLLYPVISAFWTVIVLPLRLIIMVMNLMAALVCSLFKFIQNTWGLVNHTIQLLSVAGPPAATSLKAAKSSASTSSTWKILWNDIFSQVFRAIRSIVNGLVAFFTTCNRHRLSIYNHLSAFVLRLAHLVKSAHSMVSGAYRHILDAPLLNEGDFQDEGIPLPSYCESLSSHVQRAAVGKEEDVRQGDKEKTS